MFDDNFYFDDLLENANIILEATKHDIKSAESQISRLFQHLLKYQYQPERQDKSWYDSIFGAYNEFIDAEYKNNVINSIDLDKCFARARKEALKETGISPSLIPTQKPYEWNIDFITDIDKIINYLRFYYNKNATYNIDLEKYLKNK